MKILNDFSTSVKKALEEIDPNYMSYPGLIICGTHTPKNWELMLEEIKNARENNVPSLLICFGHQLAAIEYARNVLGLRNATSEELSTEGEFVVKKLPTLKVGYFGGETYWNNYQVDALFENQMWHKPDNFITTQFHPEYQSSKGKPHPLLVKFINLCKKHGKQESRLV